MTDMKRVSDAVDAFEAAVALLEYECKEAGAYMPSLATRLRLYADVLADAYPDDTNGGWVRDE